MTEPLREEFEAWAKSKSYHTVRCANGPYVWDSTESAWKIWQASRASTPPPSELLRQALEADKRDAERYRWLRNYDVCVEERRAWHYDAKTGEALDAAIDAAMGTSPASDKATP